MEETKLISIIVPVYNAEKFLQRSIESVINQSYKNIELILIDDGSTDGSRKMCDKYAASDQKIKVLSQNNRGPAAARNTGVREASGDFVFFLDADDFIEKNTIEILINGYLKYGEPDIVMSNFKKLENNGEIVKQGVTFSVNDDPFQGQIKELSKNAINEYVRHFLKYPSNHLISYCWARLYKLSIIRDNNLSAPEDMRLFEDFVFNLAYLKCASKVLFINEPLYVYVMPNNHITASMAIIKSESLSRDMNAFKERVSGFFQPINVDTEIGHALVHYAIIFIIRSCRQITEDNRKDIYEEIKAMINAPIFRESLRYYKPQRGNSRILPILMKFKLINLLMFYCYHRANKRYGKYHQRNKK